MNEAAPSLLWCAARHPARTPAAPGDTRPMREAGLIRTIAHLVGRHDWELSWDPHGLRLTYEALTLVLGVPATLRWYLEDGPLA